MKRTTFFLDEDIDRELHLLARREKLPVAALVRDALGRYLNEVRRGKELKLRFLAVGRSGYRDTGRRAEDLLWSDLQPHPPVSAARKRERS